jgi:hypothetical protein
MVLWMKDKLTRLPKEEREKEKHQSRMQATTLPIHCKVLTGQEDAEPKQIKSGTPIHLPFEPLEAIDLSFYLPLRACWLEPLLSRFHESGSESDASHISQEDCYYARCNDGKGEQKEAEAEVGFARYSPEDCHVL